MPTLYFGRHRDCGVLLARLPTLDGAGTGAPRPGWSVFRFGRQGPVREQLRQLVPRLCPGRLANVEVYVLTERSG